MKVLKRDNQLEEFDLNKIINAVKKAYESCGKDITDDVLKELNYIQSYHNNTSTIKIETIQDEVEKILMDLAPYKVARAYIVYRDKHAESRFIQDRLDYMIKYEQSGSNAATSSETDANANVSIKNVATLEGEVYKNTNRIVQRQRMKNKLNDLYPEIAKQYEKDLNHHTIYVNDEASSPACKPYCMAASLYPLMIEGTGNIDGVTPNAPNDIQSFSGQVTNLVFLLSSQAKGAIALGEYIIALNYYVVKEFGEEWYTKLECQINTPHSIIYKDIKGAIRKGMKQFIYGVNQPAGNRNYSSPFSNLNFFDRYYFNALFKDFYYPDGSKPSWEAVDTLQRMFMELLRELRLIKPLTFPVTSVCMLHDNSKCIDDKCREWVLEEWAKGSSFFLYLSNNANSISSCCFGKSTLVSWRETRNSDDEVNTLEYLYNNVKGTFYTYYRNKLVEVKCIKLPNRKTYKIGIDGEEYIITDNHINITNTGEKKTSDLTIDDKLLFFKNNRDVYIEISYIKESNYKDDVYCLECINQEEPYFTLFSGLTTHNCRVQNEITENTFSSTIGLTGVMTGSANVITLNLNRIIQDCYRKYFTTVKEEKQSFIDNKEYLKKYLVDILDRVYKYHIAYKTMLYDMEDAKMYSSSNAGYIYLKKLYCTIGVLGYCEAAEFLGYKINNNQEYKDFLSFIFEIIQEQNKLHSIHDSRRPFVFNLEAVPGEELAIKLYNWDKEDKYFVPKEQNLYSSYFFKQWDDSISVLDKIKLHGRDINKHLGGGQACHIHLEEHLSKEQYGKLLDLAVKEGCSYYTFNIPVSECKKCGHVVNAPIKECPKCNSTNIDYWVRIIGFMRPMSSWSSGRQIEGKNRIYTKKENV